MAFSNPADAWQHLRDDTTFKSYADERLAMLYLRNVDNFPIHMLNKVFDIILDPLFKLEDITFKSFWDISDYISEYRRRAERASAVNENAHIAPQETHTYSVSPLAMSLVVDRMMEDRIPLGTLAEEEHWRDAYELNVADFHSMSLVHSTWTPIARCALQRRVVVPYYQIDIFLLSPLCGPWVREMVIYWTIDNGLEGATESHVDLSQALLRRVPQLRSLAFVSSLVWPSDQWEENDAPPFRVSECLELVPNLVPDLENLWLNLWLKHFEADVRFGSVTLDCCGEMEDEFYLSDSLERCSDVRSLSQQIPKLRSLKFLHVDSWDDLQHLDMEQHPSLETIEIHCARSGNDWYHWHRGPGEMFRWSALSCEESALRWLRESELSGLEKLQLQLRDNCFGSFALKNCGSLIHLELSNAHGERLPPVGTFPPSLKYLKIEGGPYVFPNFDSPIIQGYCGHISHLPHLRSLVLSDLRPTDIPEGMDERKRQYIDLKFMSIEEEERHTAQSHPLIELCKGRGIKFIVELGKRSIRVC